MRMQKQYLVLNAGTSAFVGLSIRVVVSCH